MPSVEARDRGGRGIEEQATTKPVKSHIGKMERSNLPLSYRLTTDSPILDDRKDTKVV
jgi:hypothetical protein